MARLDHLEPSINKKEQRWLSFFHKIHLLIFCLLWIIALMGIDSLPKEEHAALYFFLTTFMWAAVPLRWLLRLSFTLSHHHLPLYSRLIKILLLLTAFTVVMLIFVKRVPF